MTNSRTRWEYGVLIPNGASVSAPLLIGGGNLIGVFIPASWTTANLSMEVSSDGSTWSEVYDAAGNLATLVVTAAGSYIALPAGAFNGIEYIRFVSNNAGTPVNQGADRLLTCVIRPFD